MSESACKPALVVSRHARAISASSLRSCAFHCRLALSPLHLIFQPSLETGAFHNMGGARISETV